jgi:NADPH:quinone reductase-like Zn-dependent oxidoreductase
MVVRLGRRFGFKTLNVVRREETARELEALGADATVVFDGTRDEAASLQDRVNELTGGNGVPFAIDPVGGATGSAVVGCLGQGARMLAYGTLDSEPLTFSGRTLMTVGASVEGFWLSIYMASIGLVTKLRLINRIKRLMREGVLVSEVGATFPLAEIAEAVRAAEAPGKAGKVLLKIGE